ncbi:hypothetical protein HA402_006237 [Bradysia odoriphaga]|nr:hypothetical protein HA402_006237 [Bradysia odoriphaga]
MDLETISSKFTTEVLDTIVRNRGGTRHKSFRFGDGFRKGDSFLSDVYRLIVTGIKEDETEFELQMIIKSMPKSLSRRKTFRSAGFFRNECRFYEVVLRKFAEFQEAKGFPDEFSRVASCYATVVDGENDFLALEDLSRDGYKTADRTNGLDFYHCKEILTALGKFHAVSLAIKDQEPEEFKRIVGAIEEMYYGEQYRLWYEPYQLDFINVARDAMCREYGDTMYESIMKEFTGPGFFDTMIRLVRPGKYSVICHGDCWAPNFLLKYDSAGSLAVDSKMIDFQLARVASPATDISFFMYTCTQQDVRENHFDELIQIYHRSVVNVLSALGSNAEKVFPFSALQQELKNFARFGVGMAMEALPYCEMDDTDTPNLGEMEGDEAVPLNKILVIHPCKTKSGRLRMGNTFKHAIDKGFLD